MITLDDFLGVMSRYLDGSLSPSAFIERFFALRAELVQTQELAIRQNPSVSDHLEELRRLHRAGAISSTDYLDGAQAQYERLAGLPLRPGSRAASILDDLFVVADACCQPLYGVEDALALNKPELRDAVARAVRELQPE